MRPIKTMLLRRHLRKQLDSGELNDKQTAAVETALGEPRAMRATALHVGGRVGQLGDGAILKWLFEHRQEILDFVMQIIKLFS